jgi:hypothetical protein
MSITQVCVQASAAIHRARSLFPDSVPSSPGTAETAASLHQAQQRTVTSAARAGTLASVGIEKYLSMAEVSAAHIGTDAGTDNALGAQLQQAAHLSEDGAGRLDAIAGQTRATAQIAATNTTPAAQRVILSALRSQVAQAHDVVATTSRRAGAVAATIDTLSYTHDRSGSGDPTIQMVDDKTGGDALVPGSPVPGTQPQLGPFLVPPEVAHAAQSLPGPRPTDPTGGLLLPEHLPPGPGLNPRDPLYTVLHSPQPPAPLAPDDVRRLASEEVQRQMDTKERFSAATLINKTVQGCFIGGATAGLATLIVPPSDAVSIPAGCITGAFGNAGSYIWDQTTK